MVIYPDRTTGTIVAEGGSSGVASICGTAWIEVFGTGNMTLTIRTRQPGKPWVSRGQISNEGVYEVGSSQEGRQIEVFCDSGDYISGSLTVTINA